METTLEEAYCKGNKKMGQQLEGEVEDWESFGCRFVLDRRCILCAVCMLTEMIQ